MCNWQVKHVYKVYASVYARQSSIISPFHGASCPSPPYNRDQYQFYDTKLAAAAPLPNTYVMDSSSGQIFMEKKKTQYRRKLLRSPRQQMQYNFLKPKYT
jgi:hypothetical protein